MLQHCGIFALKKIWYTALSHYIFLSIFVKKNLRPFYFASPDMIKIKIPYRQTDNSLTLYKSYANFYLQLNLLPPYSLWLQGDKRKHLLKKCKRTMNSNIFKLLWHSCRSCYLFINLIVGYIYCFFMGHIERTWFTLTQNKITPKEWGIN